MAVAVPAAAAAILAVDIAETVLIQIVGQLVSEVLQAALGPELLALQQISYQIGVPGDISGGQSRALDPSTSIEAFIKGHRSQADSLRDVASTGYSAKSWQAMAETAGEPIPLQMAAEAWRRGVIPRSSPDATVPTLEKAIRDSRIKNAWTPTIEALQFMVPPIGTVIEGWLRAQIDKPTALKFAYQQGVDEATATLMFKAAGRPPGPQELLELYRRGVIPEGPTGGDTLSLHQGYLETDLKDKWYEPWKALQEYVPPPRTVTAMVREGAFSDAQALKFYKDAGLTPEVAAAYLEAAHHQRTAATKELAKADILALLMDELIDEATALGDLEHLGYAAETARFEIEIARARAEHLLLNGVLTRLRTLYVAHKLDKQAAVSALDALGLSPTARDKQLHYWDQAEQNNVAVLTAPQIASLVKLEWFSFETGVSLLEGHGYSPEDAQLFLIEHLKLTPADALPPGATISPI